MATTFAGRSLVTSGGLSARAVRTVERTAGRYASNSSLTLKRRPAAGSQLRRLSTNKPIMSPAAPLFSYNIAAAFTAKDKPYDPLTHLFHFNPYNRIQHTKGSKRSRPQSGHDAFFVSRVGDSGAVALGVADGVGGWVDSGVDPADFSHSFCHYMAAAAYEDAHSRGAGGEGGGEALTPRKLMQSGYEAVCEDKSIRAGGSTACVAIASPDGTLDVANLGDSGFLHLRLNGVKAHSIPQTHTFNTPFQLSLVPPMVARRMTTFGGTQLSDLPRDADVTSHPLRHGDVVIFGSDGLWDNLFNQDILRIASSVMTGTGAWVMTESGGIRLAEKDKLAGLTAPARDAAASPSSPAGAPESPMSLQSLLAVEITGAAKSASQNTKVDGPFAKEVQKYYPQENWHGGKVDDICVVVLVALEEQAALKSKL